MRTIMPSTTDHERSTLRSVHAALLPIIRLRGKTSPISLSLILSLLLVATHEGKTVRELSSLAGITASAASRLLADLSSVNKIGGAGLGLVEQRVDDMDGRYMRSYLSDNGRALVSKIVAEMDRRGVRVAA
jgi:DNA-binding MarR family transcriptional regulator